jgi:hypothetical protein
MLRRSLALAATALALAPSAALAQWNAPVSLTGDVAAVFRPQIVLSPRGDRVVGYGETGRFAWSRLLPGQDTPFYHRTTSTTDVAARLLLYGQGRLLLVSRTEGRLPWELRARFGDLANGPGSVRRLAPGEDVLTYDAAVDGHGDAIVAFVRNVRSGAIIRKRVVEVVRRAQGGSFTTPETIAGKGSPTAVAAAVGPGGELVVAYERGGRLEVRRRLPGHSWTSPQDVGAAVKGHTQIDLAAGEEGSFALGWFSQNLTEGGDNGPASVSVAVRSAGGRNFHTARVLATYPQRAPQEAAVRVAVGPDGQGVVGWTGFFANHPAAFTADLAGGDPQVISGDGAAVLGGVAAGLRGQAVAVWAPPADSPSPQVFAATREPGSLTLGAPEAVSAVSREIADPTVSLDTQGHALAAWVARTGDRTQAVLAALRA